MVADVVAAVVATAVCWPGGVLSCLGVLVGATVVWIGDTTAFVVGTGEDTCAVVTNSVGEGVAVNVGVAVDVRVGVTVLVAVAVEVGLSVGVAVPAAGSACPDTVEVAAAVG